MTRNVLLVVMDTARAAEVSAHIDERSPADSALASLAENASVYTEAFAAAPWTLPSHASLFTGTYPSKHGAHAEHKHLDGTLRTMAESFRDAGYETTAVTNNVWVTDSFGLDRGFDTVYKVWQYVQTNTDFGEIGMRETGLDKYRAALRSLLNRDVVVNAMNAVYGRFLYRRNDYGAGRTNAIVRSWLTSRSPERPFFLFVNYLEPHLRYQPPERFARTYLPEGCTYEEAMAISQDPWAYLAGADDHTDDEFEVLRGLYRAEIAYLDARLGELRATLEAAGEWEDTLVVVASDHGENIGDHGFMDHQYCLYDSLLHVPLLVCGDEFEPGVVDDPVQLTDLYPTLLDACGIDAPVARTQLQGPSFHPRTADDPRDRIIAEYAGPQPSIDRLEGQLGALPDEIHQYDRSLRAIRTGGYKLVLGSDGSVLLYKTDDHDEQRDRSTERPAVVDELRTQLETWVGSFEHADHGESTAMSAGTKRRLEDLGYLQ